MARTCEQPWRRALEIVSDDAMRRPCGECEEAETYCLRGALPPVDLRAVCLVRAMVFVDGGWWSGKCS